MVWNPLAKDKAEYKIGIDIGTSSIKVVELQHEKNSVRLVNYAEYYANNHYINVSPNTFGVLDTQLADILKHIFTKARFIQGTTNISLPVFSSFSTLIDLPAMNDEELEQAVKFEIRKYIPIPIGEVQFEWIKLDNLSSFEKFKILTVAVPSEIINRYNQLAQISGIKLNTMELETFSCARSLLAEDKELTIILDMGGRSTNVALVDEGVAVVHHNVNIGGRTFTRVLARGMSVDVERAEEFKQKQGLRDSNEHVDELLQTTVNKILTEVEQLMDNYLREGGRKPSRVILTGGGCLMPGLSQYIGEALKLSASVGNPFRSVEVPYQLKDVLGPAAPEFSVAVGLALIK
jgi:type IV pilus assembly protein PilM